MACPRLELEAYHQLHDARTAGTIDGTESVEVIHRAISLEVQVGGSPVRERREVHGGVDTAELRVVERVERIGAELQADTLLDGELLLQRHVPLVDSGAIEIVDAGFESDAAYLRWS